MSANRIDGQRVNGKKTILGKVAPLEAPYTITIFPIYACNFKCNYCIYSVKEELREHMKIDKKYMDFTLFKKIVDDIVTANVKLKALHIVGYGEPLLHKDIANMVDYAIKNNVAEVVDIVTNGEMLTPRLSDQLIAAGLDKLRISIQGVSADDYEKIAGKRIDFEEFVKNITYFYNNKGNTKLYIKMITDGNNSKREDEFINIFSNICDEIALENLVPIMNAVNYEEVSENIDLNKTIIKQDVINTQICPMPFYTLVINPDGKCIPCCNDEQPISVGDCNNESVINIWNNNVLNNFRIMHLCKNKDKNIVCKKCKQIKYFVDKEENLEPYANEILDKIKCKLV